MTYHLRGLDYRWATEQLSPKKEERIRRRSVVGHSNATPEERRSISDWLNGGMAAAIAGHSKYRPTIIGPKAEANC